MPGVSFDRAASFYDVTRGYPPGVDNQLRDAIVRAAGLSGASRLLELGVGTGRIALPFIRAGYDYTGVDISREMMGRLRAKITDGGLPSGLRYRLVAGDVMRAPVASGAFDAVVMVHILHLVDDWRAVLDEAVRALRPGGALILANDTTVEPETPTPPQQLWSVWEGFLDDLGVPPDQRRARAVRGLDERFDAHLRDAGARVERLALLEYRGEPRSARDAARGYRDRLFSSCWAVPDEAHAEASRRLERWLDESCPDPDTPYAEQKQIEALIARVP